MEDKDDSLCKGRTNEGPLCKSGKSLAGWPFRAKNDSSVQFVTGIARSLCDHDNLAKGSFKEVIEIWHCLCAIYRAHDHGHGEPTH